MNKILAIFKLRAP